MITHARAYSDENGCAHIRGIDGGLLGSDTSQACGSYGSILLPHSEPTDRSREAGSLVESQVPDGQGSRKEYSGTGGQVADLQGLARVTIPTTADVHAQPFVRQSGTNRIHPSSPPSIPSNRGHVEPLTRSVLQGFVSFGNCNPSGMSVEGD